MKKISFFGTSVSVSDLLCRTICSVLRMMTPKEFLAEHVSSAKWSSLSSRSFASRDLPTDVVISISTSYGAEFQYQVISNSVKHLQCHNITR